MAALRKTPTVATTMTAARTAEDDMTMMATAGDAGDGDVGGSGGGSDDGDSFPSASQAAPLHAQSLRSQFILNPARCDSPVSSVSKCARGNAARGRRADGAYGDLAPWKATRTPQGNSTPCLPATRSATLPSRARACLRY